MMNFWKNEQKNGEAKKSTPLLLLSMSCSSSLAGFYWTAAPVADLEIMQRSKNSNQIQAFISPLDSNESKRENSAGEC
jgi:hypothetical protein